MNDARDLLAGITGTVVTVIALVLGLTVVALQLASTQFSPRLLAQFLRDRATQVVLSVFTATFVYSAAGLYTVGLAGGADINEFPRLGVSLAVLLMFASMAMVVYFADHLAHSIQVDSIGARVEKETLAVLDSGIGDTAGGPPDPPAWAFPIVARRSGYIQAVRPEALLPLAGRHRLFIRLRRQVGEHIVAGTCLGWACSPRRRTRPGNRRWARGPWARRVADRLPTGRPLTRLRWQRPCTAPCRSAPRGRWSRTQRSASASWWTWPARRCRPR